MKVDELIRFPQFDIEAEQLLIGSILNNNEVQNQVGDFLKAEHFYEQIHQKIYEQILHLMDKGMSASVSNISSILSKDNSFNEIGGRQYLTNLQAMSIVVFNNYEHAKIIYDLYIKRNIIKIAEEVVNNTYESNISRKSSELLEEAEMKLFNLATQGFQEKGFERISKSIKDSLLTINRVMKSTSSITGITSGFKDLDDKLSGFHNSDLVILAGRPSMGKTALALNLALNSAIALASKHKDDPNPPSVGFFSLEMSSEQLATRILAMNSEIDSSRLKSGNINESDYNKLQKTSDYLSSLPLFIDDSGMLTISAIRTRARRLKRKNNLSILFIDYLQLISGNSKKENRVLEISEITVGLKSLAKELNIPIVVLSQLSRAVETREDKRPMLSDLRESGAIEQDADIVMFIYREEYYLARGIPPESSVEKHQAWQEKINKVLSEAEVIIAKHRNGPIGTVKLHYNSNHSKFGNAVIIPTFISK
jgi:replicative DNA helicase